MAERIYVCNTCGKTFLRRGFQQHKFDVLLKKCYDLFDEDLLSLEDEEKEDDEESTLMFIPHFKIRDDI